MLVVDDSSTARKYLADLLKRYHFNVLEAENGNQALEVLGNKEAENIRMVITDYNMPGMDGFELTKRIRGQYGPEELAIIGVSTTGNAPLSAKFIKYGANDFLSKPFLREEFFCRVAQNIDALDRIQELIRAATTDPLTGLHNRGYFFEHAEKYLDAGRRSNANPVLGIIDADFFKKVNDTYGHIAGDKVLVALADAVGNETKRKTDIVARFGGEEFCMFLFDAEPGFAEAFFERVRKNVEDICVEFEDQEIRFTVSIGACTGKTSSLMQLLETADANLYAAKEAGRNQVVLSDVSEVDDAGETARVASA